jgi:hypothetical protein
MPKDSLTNSFIVKIKWVNEALKITLQNIHTREVIELSTWPDLFKELVSQPLEQAQQLTLPSDVLEQMRTTQSNVKSGHAHKQYGNPHDDSHDESYNDDRLGRAVSKIDAAR